MENFTCHKATEEDLAILIDYRIEFLYQFSGKQTREAVNNLSAHLKEYYRKALRDETYVCFFAKSGNEIVGIGGMMIREQPGNYKNPTGRLGYLVNMYTVPAFRNKGICSALMDKLLNDAIAKGITAFELLATKEGQYVYKKFGFEIHSEPVFRKYL